jgi:hypothetical protein
MREVLLDDSDAARVPREPRAWHPRCNPRSLHSEEPEEDAMPRGDKKSYTSKQKRQASHIEASAKKRGRSSKTAARIAWATVNKQDRGGKKSGSGRGKRRARSHK